MKMKLKKRRILKNAIEQTEKPLWFVKYVLSDIWKPIEGDGENGIIFR